MRKWFLILIILFILFLLTGAVCAEEVIGIETDTLTEGLDGEVAELLPEFSSDGRVDFWESLKTVFFGSLTSVRDGYRSALRLCAVLLAVATLCAIASTARQNPVDAATIAGALALTVAVLSTFSAMIGLATQTVQDIAAYGACFLPVMASCTMMSGGVTSASSLYAGTVLFSELLMQLISKLLVPAVMVYLLLAMAEAALSNQMLSEIRELVGWLISKTLRVLMYIFIGYISVTGVLSGSSDAATLKATKAAISGMIPVVGSIVSDASESLIASATMLKSAVGIFGMLAVIAISLVPFLTVGTHYLMLKVTAAVSGTVGLKPHVKLLKNFSTAMGYLLAMCGTCALLLLISTVCFLKVVQ